MEEFWILILVPFFAINSFDKAESVELQKTPFNPLDEIFGEGWWDNDKAEEWHKLTLEQTFHDQIDRQNTQILKQKCGLSQKVFYEKEERKHLIQKFDQIKAELKRDGFKNSYHHQIDETVAKELGVSFRTIYNWKRKLGQTEPQHKYSHSEQKELLKRYYQIKDKTLKNSDKGIAKKLKIDISTLRRWKTLHPNVDDGHSVEEDAGSNVQKIVNIFE